MTAPIFLAEAEQELLESARFYERKRPGLGRDFLAEVRAAVARIEQHSESAPRALANVRAIRIRRFPFDVVYRCQGEQLIIVAVTHQSRKPGSWMNRI
jgi:plasmid stabilization system protein ParE